MLNVFCIFYAFEYFKESVKQALAVIKLWSCWNLCDWQDLWMCAFAFVYFFYFFQQTLGVLSQDGMMRFINIHTCKLLFHIGSHDEAITAVAVNPSGRHIVAVMDNGRINIYSVQNLTQELNKVTAWAFCCSVCHIFCLDHHFDLTLSLKSIITNYFTQTKKNSVYACF